MNLPPPLPPPPRLVAILLRVVSVHPHPLFVPGGCQVEGGGGRVARSAL